MASQHLVIAKLGGLAAKAAVDCFRQWESERTASDKQEWGPHQWPADTRARADDWFESLRQSAETPPTVFYAEYVDFWSFCPPCRFICDADENALSMYTDRYEGHCIELPLKVGLIEDLTNVSRDGQWPEDRLFAMLTLHAAREWEALIGGGALVFLRQIFRSAMEDQEIIDSLGTVPKWMLVDQSSK